MKLEKYAFAKAQAVLAFSFYALCVVAVALFPGSTKWLFDAWFHGLDLSGLPTQVGPASLVIVGIITFTALAWVWGYVVAQVYNSFLEK